jgi:hypothetical protein
MPNHGVGLVAPMAGCPRLREGAQPYSSRAPAVPRRIPDVPRPYPGRIPAVPRTYPGRTPDVSRPYPGRTPDVLWPHPGRTKPYPDRTLVAPWLYPFLPQASLCRPPYRHRKGAPRRGRPILIAPVVPAGSAGSPSPAARPESAGPGRRAVPRRPGASP